MATTKMNNFTESDRPVYNPGPLQAAIDRQPQGERRTQFNLAVEHEMENQEKFDRRHGVKPTANHDRVRHKENKRKKKEKNTTTPVYGTELNARERRHEKRAMARFIEELDDLAITHERPHDAKKRAWSSEVTRYEKRQVPKTPTKGSKLPKPAATHNAPARNHRDTLVRERGLNRSGTWAGTKREHQKEVASREGRRVVDKFGKTHWVGGPDKAPSTAPAVFLHDPSGTLVVQLAEPPPVLAWNASGWVRDLTEEGIESNPGPTGVKTNQRQPRANKPTAPPRERRPKGEIRAEQNGQADDAEPMEVKVKDVMFDYHPAAGCNRPNHHHPKPPRETGQPQVLNHAQQRIAKRLKKADVVACRDVANCQILEHLHAGLKDEHDVGAHTQDAQEDHRPAAAGPAPVAPPRNRPGPVLVAGPRLRDRPLPPLPAAAPPAADPQQPADVNAQPPAPAEQPVPAPAVAPELADEPGDDDAEHHDQEDLGNWDFRAPTTATAPTAHRYFYILYHYLLQILVFAFTFDALLWPAITQLVYNAGWHVAVTVSEEAQLAVVLTIWSAITVGCFFFENVWFVYILVCVKRCTARFMSVVACKRVYQFLDFIPDVAVEHDLRPHAMSFGKTKNSMAARRVRLLEVYYVESTFLGIHWEFYSVDLGQQIVSWSAFIDLAANTTKRLKEDEYISSVTRGLEKCGHIRWERQRMVKSKILVNTIELLRHYYRYLHSEELEHAFSAGLTSVYDEPSDFWRPWWTKGGWATTVALALFAVMWLYLVVKGVAIYLAIFALVYSGVTELPTMVADGVASGCSASLQGLSAFSQHLPALVPIGVYGFRLDDFIAGQFNGDDEFVLMNTNPVGANKGLKFNFQPKRNETDKRERRLTAGLTPGHVAGVSMPWHDRGDAPTFAGGIIHRGAGATPVPDPTWMQRKYELSLEVMNALFKPLDAADIPSVEEALPRTNYTLKQQATILEYERGAQKYDMTYAEHKKTTPHIKAEPGAVNKHARNIQAMATEAWESGIYGSLGVIVKSVESIFYDFPACVKHMKPIEQVNKILGLSGGTKTVCDYSSYEASFSRAVQETAQFPAYDYALQLMPDAAEFGEYLRWNYGKAHDMANADWKIALKNLKCSGDFDTSFSNYWDNVMDWITVFDIKHAVHWTDSMNWILCEGDDNITDDHGLDVEAADFARLGMTAKIETNLTLEQAGFIQKFVTQAGVLVSDPIRYLGRSSFIDVQYVSARVTKKLGLMRARAMSTLSVLPDAPVVSEHAYRVYQMTQGISVSAKMLRKTAKWGTDVVNAAARFMPPHITAESRLMVSEAWGFTLSMQEQFTAAIANWDVKLPLHLPLSWFPDSWVDFYETYKSEDVNPRELFEEAAILTTQFTRLLLTVCDSALPERLSHALTELRGDGVA